MRMMRGLPGKKSGQVIIFLAILLVILTFMVLWNFDVHKILHVKYVTQNAGDAAALMASRWQGVTLNLIGELNVMHALAISTSNTTAMTEITNIQARLCYVGPMIAFMASQHAAKNNGAYVNEAFTTMIREHAEVVRNDYPTEVGPSGELLFPEPYAGAWDEYADMLDTVADNGIAAGPDNAQFYTDIGQDHILLTLGFYEAIAGKTWCWFYHNAPDLLEDYENFTPGFCWWPDLPEIQFAHPMNSEFYGLHLTKINSALEDIDGADLGMITGSLPQAAAIDTNMMDVSATWYCYGPGRWGPWDVMSPDMEYPFPGVGSLKAKYDYAGADAVVRVESEMTRVTPGLGTTSATDVIKWNAAAKPFGYLAEEDPPMVCSLVLPAFHDVRLIALDASSLAGGGSFNVEWRIHISKHLPGYYDENGNFLEGYVPGGLDAPAVDPDCWYCQQLETWEIEGFRQEGVDWLEENSALCISPPGGGGGGGGGGGSRWGH